MRRTPYAQRYKQQPMHWPLGQEAAMLRHEESGRTSFVPRSQSPNMYLREVGLARREEKPLSLCKRSPQEKPRSRLSYQG